MKLVLLLALLALPVAAQDTVTAKPVVTTAPDLQQQVKDLTVQIAQLQQTVARLQAALVVTQRLYNDAFEELVQATQREQAAAQKKPGGQ